ncbi:MAG: IS3 family transposase [Porticoccaceae bacterium]
MAHVVGVSRSGFYAGCCRQTKPSIRATVRQTLDQRVKQAFLLAGRYGSPRLTAELVDAGTPANCKTVAASLHRQGFRAQAGKKFKATTHSKHTLPVAPNRRKQDFTTTQPSQKWVGDITSLWADEG